MNSSGRYDLRFSLWVALVASSGCSLWGSYGSSQLWGGSQQGICDFSVLSFLARKNWRLWL